MDIQELKRADWLLRELRGISRRLHRLDEFACNYGLTERQEKNEAKLEARAAELAGELGFSFYHQSDPRGCSVYLVPADWVTEEVGSNYSSGLAVY